MKTTHEILDMVTAIFMLLSIVAMFVINKKLGHDRNAEEYFVRLILVYIAPAGVLLIIIGLINMLKKLL